MNNIDEKFVLKVINNINELNKFKLNTSKEFKEIKEKILIPMLDEVEKIRSEIDTLKSEINIIRGISEDKNKEIDTVKDLILKFIVSDKNIPNNLYKRLKIYVDIDEYNVENSVFIQDKNITQYQYRLIDTINNVSKDMYNTKLMYELVKVVEILEDTIKFSTFSDDVLNYLDDIGKKIYSFIELDSILDMVKKDGYKYVSLIGQKLFIKEVDILKETLKNAEDEELSKSLDLINILIQKGNVNIEEPLSKIIEELDYQSQTKDVSVKSVSDYLNYILNNDSKYNDTRGNELYNVVIWD